MKTSDIYKEPGHLIRRAHQMATAAFTEEAKDFDLTPVQFAALIAIREQPGIDATRISDLIYFDRSTIGNVLDRLEKKGLVVRKPGVNDRRTKCLSLTPAGKTVIQKVVMRAPIIGERILAPLNQRERQQFAKLLFRLLRDNGLRSQKIKKRLESR